MNKIRTAALAAALAVLSASALAQEKDAPPPAAAPPDAAQAPPAAPASPPTEQRGVLKDDEFIPTQDIAPDEGVTFPVGI